MPNSRANILFEALFKASLNCVLYYAEILLFLGYVSFDIRSPLVRVEFCIRSTSPMVKCVLPGFLYAASALTWVYLALWTLNALWGISKACLEMLSAGLLFRAGLAAPVTLAVALPIPSFADHPRACAYVGAAAGLALWVLDKIGC